MNRKIFRELVASVSAIVSLGFGFEPVGARGPRSFRKIEFNNESYKALCKDISGGANSDKGILFANQNGILVSMTRFCKLCSVYTSLGPASMFGNLKFILEANEPGGNAGIVCGVKVVYVEDEKSNKRFPFVALVVNVKTNSDDHDFGYLSGFENIKVALTPEEAFAIRKDLSNINILDDTNVEQEKKKNKDVDFSGLDAWLVEFKRLKKDAEDEKDGEQTENGKMGVCDPAWMNSVRLCSKGW